MSIKMMTKEMMQRALNEFAELAMQWHQKARSAEIEREHLAYQVAPQYNRQKVQEACDRFAEADYMAESRAWIRRLIAGGIVDHARGMED